MKILIVTEYYLPGYKAGGPIRTLASITDYLGDEFDFFILTSDRDKSSEPYPGIEPGVWQEVGKAHVLYLRPAEKHWGRWRYWLNALDYDVIYLNGCFSRLTIKTLVLSGLCLLPKKPVILAPRGEFSPGALNLKKHKKRLYLKLSRALHLYKGVIWQASSAYELQDIVNTLQITDSQIIVAPNLVSGRTVNRTTISKEAGILKMVFLSRISRKKHLTYALQVLVKLSGHIIFDIYGPIEDPPYWQECQSIVAQLPRSIQVNYRGEVMPEQVMATLSKYHLFFLPTLGENFGHVISEALRAGCPVLISDQTPWQGLERQQAGWVVPLAKPEQFQAVINSVLEMENDQFQEWATGARVYGEQTANAPAVVEANRQLFLAALNPIERD